jgi:signal transduction histidine kinase
VLRRIAPRSLRSRATLVLGGLTAVALVAGALTIQHLVRDSVANATRQELQRDLASAVDFVSSSTAPAPGYGPRATTAGTIEALNGGAAPGCATAEALTFGKGTLTLSEYDKLPIATPTEQQQQAADECVQRELGHGAGPTEANLSQCYEVVAASYGDRQFTYDQATEIEYSDDYSNRVSACLQQRDPATTSFNAAAAACNGTIHGAFDGVNVLTERAVLDRFDIALGRYVGCLHRHGQPGVPKPVIQRQGGTTQVSLPSLGTEQTLVLPATRPIIQGLDRFGESLRYAIPLLVLGVLVLAYLSTRAVLRPVDLMRAQVDAITEQNLGQRVAEPRRGDEVARLAQTMNRMLQRLDDATTRQRQFISDASHELRTPVATLRAELDLMKARSTSDMPRAGAIEADETVDNLDQQVARVEHLVDDLFALAVYDEATATKLRHEDVDLDHLIATELAQRNDPHPTSAALSSARVRGDTAALTRVMRNLLDNAQRYASTIVVVALTATEDHVRITVDDDGPGIAPADRERVFERFVRADESRDRGFGGNGIGLAIVHRVVLGHGGTVGAGEAPSGGARIEVTLPRPHN